MKAQRETRRATRAATRGHALALPIGRLRGVSAIALTDVVRGELPAESFPGRPALAKDPVGYARRG